jgi:hypothetical protein
MQQTQNLNIRAMMQPMSPSAIKDELPMTEAPNR